MTIYAIPNTQYKATLSAQDYPSLVGTVGVEITTEGGATVTARTTSGITEYPAASGIYHYTGTSPGSTGSYVVLWDTGGSTPVYASEDLIVSASPIGPIPTPGPRDLTTLGEAREFIGLGDDEHENDNLIQRFVTQASDVIHAEAGREFIKDPQKSDTRIYEFAATSWIGREIPIDDYHGELADLATLSVSSYGASTPITVTDAVLLPRNKPSGVYTRIRLPYTAEAYFGSALVVETPYWGFASVPARIRAAATVTVGEWYARDVQNFSRTFSLDEQHVIRPQVLPDAVRDIVYGFRRLTVG